MFYYDVPYPKLKFLYSFKKLLIWILCFSYAGRATAASTATGSKVMHLKELRQLLDASMAF